MADNNKIGEMNGWRGKLFTILLPLVTFALPIAFTWGVWVTTTLVTLRTEIQKGAHDRFTTSMYIEVQGELDEKNPNMKWLTASEVRKIQHNNYPYKQ